MKKLRKKIFLYYTKKNKIRVPLQKKKKLRTRSSSMLLKIVEMKAIAQVHFVIVIDNVSEFSHKTLQKSYLQLLRTSKIMMLVETIFWSFKRLSLYRKKRKLREM